MIELDNAEECKSAVPKIQSLVPNSAYSGALTMNDRPPGCFYHPTNLKFYWNKDKSGTTCSICASLCKGSMIKT